MLIAREPLRVTESSMLTDSPPSTLTLAGPQTETPMPVHIFDCSNRQGLTLTLNPNQDRHEAGSRQLCTMHAPA